MNYSVVIDWKFVVACGATAVATIFAVKMNAADAKEVSIHAVDACKEYAMAING
ncbi:MAG: MFS transporter [Clostridia bacterium]|nr:MFS transporter [Clostridia bacterium]